MQMIQALFQKTPEKKGIIKFILVVTPFLGAFVAIINFGKIYDSLSLPRPMFTTEFVKERVATDKKIAQVSTMLRDLEIEFRNRAIKTDLRYIRDIEKEINDLLQKNITIPDSLLDFKSSLQESIDENKSKLKDLDKPNF